MQRGIARRLWAEDIDSGDSARRRADRHLHEQIVRGFVSRRAPLSKDIKSDIAAGKAKKPDYAEKVDAVPSDVATPKRQGPETAVEEKEEEASVTVAKKAALPKTMHGKPSEVTREEKKGIEGKASDGDTTVRPEANVAGSRKEKKSADAAEGVSCAPELSASARERTIGASSTAEMSQPADKKSEGGSEEDGEKTKVPVKAELGKVLDDDRREIPKLTQYHHEKLTSKVFLGVGSTRSVFFQNGSKTARLRKQRKELMSMSKGCLRSSEKKERLKEKLTEDSKEEEEDQLIKDSYAVARQMKNTETCVPKNRFQDAKEDRQENRNLLKDSKEATEKGGSSSAAKGHRKDVHESTKVYKSKEKGKVPERRVGSRRLSYFREDIFNLLRSSDAPAA